MTRSTTCGSVHKSDSPCVVVLHEAWGPDSHISGVCKRLRKLGFATAVPRLYRGNEDVLTPLNIQESMEAVWGLSLEDRRDGRKVAAELTRRGASSKIKETLSVLYDQQFRDEILEITMNAVRDARSDHGSVATLGFSLGGGLSLATATKPAPPDSVVAYCAEPPNLGPGGASVPILAIYASQDELVGSKVPAFVDAAIRYESDVTLRIIPNTKHDFFNETKKGQYNHAAAEGAWRLTESFLFQTVGLPGWRASHALSKR